MKRGFSSERLLWREDSSASLKLLEEDLWWRLEVPVPLFTHFTYSPLWPLWPPWPLWPLWPLWPEKMTPETKLLPRTF